MIVNSFRCDQCGAERQKTNHWFVVEESSGGELLLTKWNVDIARHNGAKHICGRACLTKLVEVWTQQSAVFLAEPKVIKSIPPTNAVCIGCGHNRNVHAGEMNDGPCRYSLASCCNCNKFVI